MTRIEDITHDAAFYKESSDYYDSLGTKMIS